MSESEQSKNVDKAAADEQAAAEQTVPAGPIVEDVIATEQAPVGTDESVVETGTVAESDAAVGNESAAEEGTAAEEAAAEEDEADEDEADEDEADEDEADEDEAEEDEAEEDEAEEDEVDEDEDQEDGAATAAGDAVAEESTLTETVTVAESVTVTEDGVTVTENIVVTESVTDVVATDHVQNLRLLEALIFAGTQALDEKSMVERLPDGADVAQLIADLAEMYAGRGVNLVKVAGGYAFRTAPDLAERLKIERPVTRKLSRASVETLAIIAYHQPVTRAEIEQVRGVGLSKGTLDLLFEQNWIKPMGRRRAPGKPVTWGTTDFFLEHFGLAGLDDLPGHEELKAAGLLDARSQPPIFRPEEPDLPLEPAEDEADEPLAIEEKGR
jgi:segregation and condensation protein B